MQYVVMILIVRSSDGWNFEDESCESNNLAVIKLKSSASFASL